MPVKHRIREATNRIIVGCSHHTPDENPSVFEISRDFGIKGYVTCPYHHIIKRDGTIIDMRNVKQWSGICSSPELNKDSISVMLIGGSWKELDAIFLDNYTIEQLSSLDYISRLYKNVPIVGLGEVEENPALGPFFDPSELRFTHGQE